MSVDADLLRRQLLRHGPSGVRYHIKSQPEEYATISLQQLRRATRRVGWRGVRHDSRNTSDPALSTQGSL